MRPSEISKKIQQLYELPGMPFYGSRDQDYLDEDTLTECRLATEQIMDLKARKAALIMKASEALHEIQKACPKETYVRFRHAGGPVAVMFFGPMGERREEHIPASEFNAEEFGLGGEWNLGGVYCQDEDRRQDFIDAMLRKVRVDA